jgi:hypothetical protein
MITTRFVAVVLFTSLVSTATEQLAGPGLTWAGTAGASAGSFAPSCANLPVVVVPGETVTLRVWGDPSAPFGLFAAPSGSRSRHHPLPGPPRNNQVPAGPALRRLPVAGSR